VAKSSSALVSKVLARIRREGPISFRDFMEAALYDPRHGYYARGGRIGEGGDFVTSPAISPLFARAVARVFAQDAPEFDGEIAFIEAAAGAGRFLADFRAALTELSPETAARARLLAIERSDAGRRRIEELGVAERVSASAGDLPADGCSGWVFSNELYDALPVHRVLGDRAGLRELLVGEEGGRPAWTSRPAPRELAEYLESFGVRLEPGQAAEINLEAAPLHRSLCRLLRRGRVLAFDYGHRAAVLYHPHARPSGTLAVHSRGVRGGDPLERPGEVDLTAHVNWDDLARAGEAEGFRTESVLRQSRFLLEAGLFEDARERKLEALRLFDPEGLGEAISVLVQSKDLPRLRPVAQLTSVT
jgi:SAM-dependent MidA family methyltransferase